MSDNLKKLLSEGDAKGIIEEIKKLIKSDDDLKKEVSLMDDMSFYVSLGGQKIGVQIKNGEIFFVNKLDKPEFFIEISQKTLSNLLGGKRDLISSLMGGDIVTWKEGEPYDASKLNILTPLMISLTEKIGVTI
jgi:putative sterol carrier protein